MARIIGKSIERLDAVNKARGRAKYSADYYEEGMLNCFLLRSEKAHAKLISIEVPTLPDGIFCYTARDIKNNIIPSIMNDQVVFASNHIRYHGEPLAVIAAEKLEDAKAFAKKIKVNLEELPVLDDYEKALDEDSPKLFEKGNLCSEFHNNKGDVEKAFSESSLILEETFHMPIQCHGYLETESAFTFIDNQKRLALISSTQNAYSDKLAICSALGLSENEVTSSAAVVGGGFGGKDGVTSQLYPAIVTYYTKKPAKIVFSREENIRYGFKRHQGTVKCKVGFSSDGLIKALQGYMILDTGSYAVLGPAVLSLGLEHMSGPYYIQNVKLDGHLVYTNHAIASAMRGFGAPQSTIGIETFLNRAAKKLGLDAIDIRIKNAICENQEGSMGGRILSCTKYKEALEQFKKSEFAKEMYENKDPEIGYGISGAVMSYGMGKGVVDDVYVTLKRIEDGKVRIETSLVDIGQGSETTLSMIASEALEVPLDKIEMVMGITDGQANSGSTAASRSTYVAGNAIIKASQDFKNGKENTTVVFSCPETEENAIHKFFSYMVLGVKVSIDRITGEVRVLKAHNVTEAGNIINPELLSGQVFGGIVMALGYTLTEQFRYKNGIALEDSMNSYIMPTALDAPSLSNENVPSYEKTGPFGAKGVAECSTVAAAPAVISAINNIIDDVNITKLPIDRLLLIRRS